jgi:uncharacterized DUF497 family protein
MELEFNPQKDFINQEKHGIGFKRVEDFDFETAHFEIDPRVYNNETRYRAYGVIDERLYILIYTIRDNKIRVISLRKANQREQRYAKKKNANL